ncbi:sulfite exporter TauE/SafE family protein, partial [Alkalihalophilus pseudofirmus]
LSAFMIFKIRKEVDKSLLIRLIKGSIVGLLFGIFIYLFLDIQILKMAVGILIIMLTVLLIFKLTLNRTRNRDFTAGGIKWTPSSRH